jgi:branched-chain amino acid transport system substrate-binding protein
VPRRRTFLAAAALPFLARRVRARDSRPAIRIGVLWSRAGIGEVTSGLDQIVAAHLAVEDFGPLRRGDPVEVLDAGFDHRPDRATAIARHWLDFEKVAVIVDLPGMAAPVQVQHLARKRDRSVMNTGSVNPALSGVSCALTGTQWMEDTNDLPMAMTLGMAAEGVRTWFLAVPDDAIGAALHQGAEAAIARTGGELVGFVRYPADTRSFATLFAAARGTSAAAIGLCAYGLALEAQVREGRSAGLFDDGRTICAYAAGIKEIHAVGPVEARDLRVVTGFYWNQNDRTRSFAKRFRDVTTRMPDKPYAATYAAIAHFLHAVDTSDTIDGLALNARFRGAEADFFGAPCRLRADGRLLQDIGLYRVKPPERVASAWDYYQPVRVLPARDVFRSPDGEACPLPP